MWSRGIKQMFVQIHIALNAQVQAHAQANNQLILDDSLLLNHVVCPNDNCVASLSQNKESETESVLQGGGDEMNKNTHTRTNTLPLPCLIHLCNDFGSWMNSCARANGHVSLNVCTTAHNCRVVNLGFTWHVSFLLLLFLLVVCLWR